MSSQGWALVDGSMYVAIGLGTPGIYVLRRRRRRRSYQRGLNEEQRCTLVRERHSLDSGMKIVDRGTRIITILATGLP